jgi:hypothetical protein
MSMAVLHQKDILAKDFDYPTVPMPSTEIIDLKHSREF